jgi:phenylacetate-CoA ligase
MKSDRLLVDFNILENILDDTEGVGAWQIELRKCNDDRLEKDEIIIHVVPMGDAGDDLKELISRTLVEATEISPNRIDFQDWKTMRKMHGVGKVLKEQKVIDNRPK